jgi:predicted Fe-Mo cluster-binding NifX family protein
LESGRIALEIVEQAHGVDWVVPRLAEIAKRNRAAVVVHRTGPFGYAIPELEKAGVRVHAATSAEYGDAVARFRTLAASGDLAHGNDSRLNSAVDNGVSRRSGDRELWSRRDAGTDISALVAATFAAWKCADPPAAPVVVAYRKP